MCHFITAFLSADAKVQAVARLAEESKLSWKRIHNPHVEQHLRPGETYYYTTRNMCNCGTALGTALRASSTDVRTTLHQEQERKKLQKKGWSESKIERHFRDRDSAREKQEKAHAALLPTADDPEIVRWLSFIGTVHERQLATTVGLLLHFYNAGIGTERFPLRRVNLPPVELTAERLLAIEEDILYAFVSR